MLINTKFSENISNLNPFSIFITISKVNGEKMNSISLSTLSCVFQPKKVQNKPPVQNNLFFKSYGITNDIFVKSKTASIVSFKGLKEDISKRLIASSGEILSIINKNPSDKGIVGELPQEWLDKIPSANRAKALANLNRVMGEIACELRNNASLKENSKKLEKAFKKAGIITKEQTLELKSCGAGDLGWIVIPEILPHTFKKEYVLKIFHTNKQIKAIQGHGMYNEINNAFFWNTQAGTNTQKPPVYQADFNNGFYITDYLDENSPEPFYIVPKVIGVIETDISRDNYMYGYDFDYGGLEKFSVIADYPEAIKASLELYKTPETERIEKWNKTFNTAKAHRAEKLAALAAGLWMLPESIDRSQFIDKIIKENNNSLALQALVTELTDKEYVRYFNTLQKVPDNNLKALLIDRINNLPGKAPAKWVKQFANIDSEVVQTSIAKHIRLIPSKKRAKWAKKQYKNSNNETKKVILNNIYSFSSDHKVQIYNLFLNDFEILNPDIQEKLIKSLSALPYPERLSSFKKLAKLNCEKTNALLAGVINYLSKPEAQKWFETFASKNNKNINISLARIIDRVFEPAKRLDWFRKLAKQGDKELLQTLFNYNHYLPKDERVSFFVECAAKANYETKLMMAQKLFLMDDSAIYECSKALSKNADDNLLEKIIENQFCMPEEDKLKWFEEIYNSASNHIKSIIDTKRKSLNCA